MAGQQIGSSGISGDNAVARRREGKYGFLLRNSPNVGSWITQIPSFLTSLGVKKRHGDSSLIPSVRQVAIRAESPWCFAAHGDDENGVERCDIMGGSAGDRG
jgi:hypothetical protein